MYIYIYYIPYDNGPSSILTMFILMMNVLYPSYQLNPKCISPSVFLKCL